MAVPHGPVRDIEEALTRSIEGDPRVTDALARKAHGVEERRDREERSQLAGLRMDREGPVADRDDACRPDRDGMIGMPLAVSCRCTWLALERDPHARGQAARLRPCRG